MALESERWFRHIGMGGSRRSGTVAPLRRYTHSMQLRKLKHELKSIIDLESDSLRFYNLGESYSHRVVHLGTKFIPDVTGNIIL